MNLNVIISSSVNNIIFMKSTKLVSENFYPIEEAVLFSIDFIKSIIQGSA